MDFGTDPDDIITYLIAVFVFFAVILFIRLWYKQWRMKKDERLTKLNPESNGIQSSQLPNPSAMCQSHIVQDIPPIIIPLHPPSYYQSMAIVQEHEKQAASNPYLQGNDKVNVY